VRRSTADSLAVYQLRIGAHRSEDDDRCDDDRRKRAARSSDHADDDDCRPQPPADAVTLNAYGRGAGAFAGVDMLSLAARDGQTSAAADDLRTLLHLVQPAGIDLFPGSVVPVQLTVTNQGIAVPVSASADVPAGAQIVDPGSGIVSGTTVTFAFPLEVAEVKTVRYWLRLPGAAGPVMVRAMVSATHGAQTFTVAPSLSLTVVAPQTLDQLRSSASALAGTDRANAAALLKAAAELREASRERNGSSALGDVLDATDALLGIPSAGVVGLRVAIDQWLRTATQVNDFPDR
jgi:hypothetical protein